MMNGIIEFVRFSQLNSRLLT